MNKLMGFPTSEEVCQALSEYYGKEVSYSNQCYNAKFYFEESRLGIVMIQNNCIYFIVSMYHTTNYLPAYLVTLIGKFYEGVENDFK